MAQLPDPNNLQRQARRQGQAAVPTGFNPSVGVFDLNRTKRANQQLKIVQSINNKPPTFQQLERLRRERSRQPQGVSRELPSFEAVDRKDRDTLQQQSVSRELPNFNTVDRKKRQSTQQQGVSRELPGFEAVDRRARSNPPVNDRSVSSIPDDQELEREYRRAAEGRSLSKAFASEQVAHKANDSLAS